MAGLAAIASELGFKVTGSDRSLYPPMSTQLQQLGIEVRDLDDPGQFFDHPDQIVIGNALSRGQVAIEYVLDHGLDYISGPDWLARNVLSDRWVLAVAGTHGKTTTSSMLAWILEQAGLKPGFLIGGIPGNFPCSACLGSSPYFVIEADEYDTAFFDKRSKFVHYRPRTAILHNLEFDHADIFDNIEAIIRQFHHLVRTIPANGRIIVNGQDRNIAEVLDRGCWSEVQNYAVLPTVPVKNETDADLRESNGPESDGPETDWPNVDWPTVDWPTVDWNMHYENDTIGATNKEIIMQFQKHPEVALDWSVPGLHNAMNALAAVAAARHVGIHPDQAVTALQQFVLPKRRLELLFENADLRLYDDFAHHPTAIKFTLETLKKRHGGRLLALFEPRSNTMRMGAHREQLAEAFQAADKLFILEPARLDWDVLTTMYRDNDSLSVLQDPEQLFKCVLAQIRPGDTICSLSNGGFNGIPYRLRAHFEKNISFH